MTSQGPNLSKVTEQISNYIHAEVESRVQKALEAVEGVDWTEKFQTLLRQNELYREVIDAFFSYFVLSDFSKEEKEFRFNHFVELAKATLPTSTERLKSTDSYNHETDERFL